jgi:hypothetical protein
MGLRAFTFDPSALLVFLSGGSNTGNGPSGPVGVPPVDDGELGPQPPSEKELNFCPIAGLIIAYEGPDICIMGVPVDERTQTFISGVPFDENTQTNYR